MLLLIGSKWACLDRWKISEWCRAKGLANVALSVPENDITLAVNKVLMLSFLIGPSKLCCRSFSLAVFINDISCFPHKPVLACCFDVSINRKHALSLYMYLQTVSELKQTINMHSLYSQNYTFSISSPHSNDYIVFISRSQYYGTLFLC